MPTTTDGSRLERNAQSYAIASVVPEHLEEVRGRRLAWIDKAHAAVRDRLTKEISYWDHRAEELKLQEQAGKTNARVNSKEARRRADSLQARLQRRLEKLDLQKQISALPPVVLGGLIVVPMGLLAEMTGTSLPAPLHGGDTQAAAARARAAVMEVERSLGFDPVDRELERLGYDIESRNPHTGTLRFLEVKGRVAGAETVTVTKNEILYSLNKPEDFILAIVAFDGADKHRVHYVRRSSARTSSSSSRPARSGPPTGSGSSRRWLGRSAKQSAREYLPATSRTVVRLRSPTQSWTPWTCPAA